jgi:superfamily I DNA/RNA helicase
VLSPSHDAWTRRVLQSIAKQAAAKNLGPFYWTEESTEGEECVELLNALGVNNPNERNLPWNGPLNHSMLVVEVARRVDQIRRGRSLNEITRGSVAYVARRLIHGFRTRGDHRGKRIVTTVHGAKNREFDQVFLLWPFRLPPNIETQRRLLYNGLSRARVNAMLLMLGDDKRAATDPVLSLLGQAQPAFPRKAKTKAKGSRR